MKMVQKEKEQLINAVNSKGGKNIFEIYYDIGRAAPFVVQRFPGGRCSDWYKSQYVEVHQLKPGGIGGIYGQAYGFYYRNGVRADSSENPDLCWCRKDDEKPQLISNSGCGGWFLLDIMGEPTTDTIKILELNDIIEFGKHNGKKLIDVVHEDFNWVKWAITSSSRFYCNNDAVFEEHEKDIKVLLPTDTLQIGKYKGQSILSVFEKDPEYLMWLKENVDDIEFDLSSILKNKK